jgi:hypothetical protein
MNPCAMRRIVPVIVRHRGRERKGQQIAGWVPEERMSGGLAGVIRASIHPVFWSPAAIPLMVRSTPSR